MDPKHMEMSPSASSLVAWLVNLEAARHSGRVQITMDFQEGGVRRLHVAEVTTVQIP
jgi:hypothetical protein